MRGCPRSSFPSYRYSYTLDGTTLLNGITIFGDRRVIFTSKENGHVRFNHFYKLKLQKSLCKIRIFFIFNRDTNCESTWSKVLSRYKARYAMQ